MARQAVSVFSVKITRQDLPVGEMVQDGHLLELAATRFRDGRS